MSMIKARLREFKLSGIYNSYEERIKYAQSKSLSYEEFLELLLEDEVNNRRDNSYKKRYSKAKFPYSKNIEDFDFAFQPSIDKIINEDKENNPMAKNVEKYKKLYAVYKLLYKDLKDNFKKLSSLS